ncbi:hypothetical protein [Pseudomonas sp. KT_2_4]|uniref:hypothetical protein n=1 Tax=Pseudomonas sp. KT_2_4 TaxID=3241600 RepID=UPI00352AF047
MDEEDKLSVLYASDKFKVSYGEFIRFLDGVKMSTTCPHCGTSDSWTVFTGSAIGKDQEFLTAYKMPIAGTTYYRLCFSMSCENCGTFRSIYANRVVEWVKENPELPQ